MTASLTFDAVAEAVPGPKWAARWARSWPAYGAWFAARGGDAGPTRAQAEAALAAHMPELVPVHARLTALAGGSDRAARFLAAWCPPNYLGGCSLAAVARGGEVRLVRNYDLSPDLNEGLLLRTEWVRPVMGMVEFLWGLSDGINDAGLSVALAYGGRQAVGRGFGITLIVRYVLETCDTVAAALEVLARVPSHMPYNLVLADAGGAVASVEMFAGGGMARRPHAIAANHQHDGTAPDRGAFTRTYQRAERLGDLAQGAPGDLAPRFLQAPLRQARYAEGFGTLFTAEYDPAARSLALHWPDAVWRQSLEAFAEGTRTVRFDDGPGTRTVGPQTGREDVDWSNVDWANVDWRNVDWGNVDWAGVDWAGVDWNRYGADLVAGQVPSAGASPLPRRRAA